MFSFKVFHPGLSEPATAFFKKIVLHFPKPHALVNPKIHQYYQS